MMKMTDRLLILLNFVQISYATVENDFKPSFCLHTSCLSR